MHLQEKPPLAALAAHGLGGLELAHYGKKGMKWGIRKGYTDRQAVTGKALIDAGQGKGTRAERIATRVVTGNTLMTNKSLVRQGQRRVDHAARIKSGKAKTSDMVKMYGGFTIYDIKRQPADYARKTGMSVKEAKQPSNKTIGVRKGYVERRKMQGNFSGAVANNKGKPLLQKAANRNMSGAPFMPKGYHSKRASVLRDHAARIEKGKATKADLVVMYGTAHPFDLRVQPKGYGKKK